MVSQKTPERHQSGQSEHEFFTPPPTTTGAHHQGENKDSFFPYNEEKTLQHVSILWKSSDMTHLPLMIDRREAMGTQTYFPVGERNFKAYARISAAQWNPPSCVTRSVAANQCTPTERGGC